MKKTYQQPETMTTRLVMDNTILAASPQVTLSGSDTDKVDAADIDANQNSNIFWDDED